MKRKVRFKSKVKIKRKKSNIILLIIVLILIITFFMLKKFSDVVTPKVVILSKQKANEVVYNVITNNVNRYVLDDSKLLEDIIMVTKNNDEEILMADFNLENAYLLIRNITKSIDDNIKLNNEDDGIYFEVPIGYYLNSSFLSNLGPRIPVKINFTGNILSNLKTKITNYGMNNALVELYANIVIVEEIITPVTNKIIKIDYDVLLASKLINGRVPSFYGGSLEKESSIIEMSSNNK